MAIQVRNVTLRELIDAVKKAGIRRVLLTDYASTQMKPEGDVFKGCTEESAARVSIRAIGG